MGTTLTIDPAQTWRASSSEGHTPSSFCGSCGRPIYFRDPDPTTCAPCLLHYMAGLRSLRRGDK